MTPEEVAGQELRHLRNDRGWSQEEVAKRMKAYGYEWHQTMVGRIEAADRPLRLNEAVHLAALFGISLEAFLTRTHRELDAVRLRDRIGELQRLRERARERLAAAEADWMEAQERELRAAQIASAAREEANGLQGEIAALDRALRLAEKPSEHQQ